MVPAQQHSAVGILLLCRLSYPGGHLLLQDETCPFPKGLSQIQLILQRRQRGFGLMIPFRDQPMRDQMPIGFWVQMPLSPANFMLAEYCQSTATQFWALCSPSWDQPKDNSCYCGWHS
ncbi:hypothetical protein ACLKA7_015132 [Drosophila subpalustris]